LKDGQTTWNYTYYFEKRLTTVKLRGFVQNKPNHDVEGRRLRLWNSQAGYVNHVYSGLDIIFENSSSGCTKHFYAYGLHIAENRSGVIEYYHQDHLGSTRLKTNSTGGVVSSSNYIPFGPAYDSEGSEEFKYNGKYEDTSGLYYYGARYYDPEAGRFITEDPVVGSRVDPQSLNRYVYCRSNPLKYTDPDGRFLLNIVAGALAGAAIEGLFYYAASGFTDWQGALVHAGIGACKGAIFAATFGTAALALTSGATSMTEATTAIASSVGKTLLAGTVSGVAGGMMERGMEGVSYYGGQHHFGAPAPGTERPDWREQSFVAHAAGGAVGSYAGQATQWVIAQNVDIMDEWLYILSAELTGEVAGEIAEKVTCCSYDYGFYDYGYDFSYYVNDWYDDYYRSSWAP